MEYKQSNKINAMQTKNNFAETAKTFQENVAKGMKSIQDVNKKLLETQMKAASDLFSKALETFQEEGSVGFSNSINASSKVITELFQQNIETANDYFKNAKNSTSEFIKNADQESVTDEINKQLEAFNERVADLAILNQTTLVTVLKQFETSVKSFTPVNEQLKKEIEKTVETNQTINDSYSAFTASSVKATNETLEKLNDLIKTRANAGYKFWLETMNSSTVSTPGKTSEATIVDNELWKPSANGINKKTAMVI
jgi:hypothetical protein